MTLRTILESTTDTMTDTELREVLALTTEDIMVNRVGFKQRTSLRYLTEVAGIALDIIRRTKSKR